MRKIHSNSLLFIVVLTLPSSFLFAQSRKEIGNVVTTQGAVSARDPAGALRTLERRSPVFEGDVIVVAANGFTSLRMVDNAHLSLGPATEFSFDTYSYDGRSGTRDTVVMRLLNGCFRTRVGTAGSGRRDEYRIDTPLASIGIDGSFHGAALVDGRLYTAAWDGSTTVSNVAGSLNLGEYGEYDYSRTLPGAAPTGLGALLPEAACEPPEALDGTLDTTHFYRPDDEVEDDDEEE